jgi:hypothetical protein
MKPVRKSIMSQSGTGTNLPSAGSWLSLEKLARIELSSEDPDHPFEHALRTDTAQGWMASTPGPQTIRLCFDEAQPLRRVRLQFREERVERTQEVALFATVHESPKKELVRQQWMFSPRGATDEVEDYCFDLEGVTAIELQIDPGRHDKAVFATLEAIQIG